MTTDYQPVVSIIIPCFNAEDCIQRSLDSALAQTYEAVEIICVDNGSTDNTWGKLEGFKVEHPELVLLKEAQKGAGAARNCGLRAAKGEWIQFLDADDFIFG